MILQIQSPHGYITSKLVLQFKSTIILDHQQCYTVFHLNKRGYMRSTMSLYAVENNKFKMADDIAAT